MEAALEDAIDRAAHRTRLMRAPRVVETKT